MDTANFIVHLKTGDIYKDITENVEIRFGISNFELYKPFPKRKDV